MLKTITHFQKNSRFFTIILFITISLIIIFIFISFYLEFVDVANNEEIANNPIPPIIHDKDDTEDFLKELIEESLELNREVKPIILNWDRPSGSGKLTYKIDRKVGQGDWETLVGNTQSNSTQYIDHDVIPGVVYSYTTSPMNKEGTGAPSLISQGSTTSSFLTINWNDNNLSESVLYYIIQRKINDGEFKDLATRNGNYTSYVDTNLIPCAQHQYKVGRYIENQGLDFGNIKNHTEPCYTIEK